MPVDLIGGSVELMVENNGKFVPIESTVGLGPAVHFVDSVRVTMGLFRILNIDVTLNPPIEIALKLLRSGNLGFGFSVPKPVPAPKTDGSDDTMAKKLSGLSVVMNKIAVRMHYGGMSSPWYKGLLLQPEVDINTEGITIQLKAVGMLFDAAKTYVTKSFDKEMTTEQIVRELLGKEIEPDIKPEARALLSQKHGGYTTTKNNFESAKEILQKKHCKMVLAGAGDLGKQRVLIFSANEEKNKEKANAEFVAFRQINPSLRQFPMFSFSAPIQNLLVGPWCGFNLGFLKKDDKSKTRYAADAEDVAKTRSKLFSNGSMGGGASQAPTDSTGNAGGISRSDQAAKTVPAIYRDAINNTIDNIREFVHDFVDHVFEYDVTTVMVPDLLPGHVVKVSISDIKEFNGTYGVMEVTHSITSSGAETQSRLYRTAGLVQATSAGIETVKTATMEKFSRKSVSPSSSGVLK